MPQIPLYQERSAPTTQTPVREVSGAPMAAMGQAVAGIGKEMFSIGRDYAKKMESEETDAQTAKYYADRKLRSNAIQSSMSTEKDPETVKKMYEAWRDEENEIFTNSNLNGNARKNISLNNEMFYANNEIDANTFYQKARIGQMDNTYVDLYTMALNGETHQLEDGTVLSPEELAHYAIDKRVSLGTVDYDTGAKLKQEFGQDLQFRKVVSVADNDINEAEKLLKESSLTGERLVRANDAVRDAKDKQAKITSDTHRRTTDEVTRDINNKVMSRQQLEKLSKQTVNIMGKDTPVIPESVVSASKASLDASEDFDTQMYAGRIDDINKLIKGMADQGSSDMGTPETDKVYRAIAVLGRDGASKATMESLLNFANTSASDYAEGRGWNNGSVKMIYDITDAYTTMYAESELKYKNIDPVASILTKLDSFHELMKETKGKPSDEQLATWRKENMGKLDRDMALNKFYNQYRVGEVRQDKTGDKIYRGNGIYEEVR